MKIPINDEFEAGQELTCFTVYWPDTPRWIGLLQGLLTMIQQGRFWDEKTGSIKAMQAIGAQIEGANMPLTTCDGSDPSGGDGSETEDTKIVTRYVQSLLDTSELEQEIIMSMLCGANPGNYKIENGVLYVRAHCDTYPGADDDRWVAIGEINQGPTGVPSVPDMPGYTPGQGLDSATACTKATQIAVLTYNIIQAGFNSIDYEDLVWGWYEFAERIRAQISGINLGDTELYSMFGSVYVLSVAGYENETEDQAFIDDLECAWNVVLEPGSTGVTPEQYGTCKDLLTKQAQEHFGDSNYSGFGKEMRHVWEHAFAAIGAKDITKVTTGLVSTGLEDCACEGDNPLQLPDWIEDGDWYMIFNFQGNLPLDCTLRVDNGISVITPLGLALEANTSGSDKTGFTWTPGVTGSTVNRVKIEFLAADAWIAEAPWVGVGFSVGGVGGNRQSGIVGTGGVYVWEKTDASFDAEDFALTIESDVSGVYDPIHPIVARCILSGTGPHPYGL